MIMIFPHVFLLLLLPLSLNSISTRISASSFSSAPSLAPSSVHGTCDRSCLNRTQVPYPFGFSAGCEIQLNCEETGEITIGQFQVQNVTEDSILINIPPNCNRTIQDLDQLRGDNFAITWRNGLIFDNCSEPVNGCAIPMELIETKLKMNSCIDIHSSNMSCYSNASSENSEFFELDHLKQIKCGVVFSSIAALDDTRRGRDNNTNTNNSSSLSTALLLNFQMLELEWWLEGPCDCDKSAKCTNFSIPSGGQGYRCRCNEGFAGNGFNASGGCKRGNQFFRFYSFYGLV